jgi:hypothetical protein
MIPWMLLESHYDAKPLFNQLLGKADPHLGLCNGGLSL